MRVCALWGATRPYPSQRGTLCKKTNLNCDSRNPWIPCLIFFLGFFLARVVGCSSLSCNRLWMLKILLYMYCNVSMYGLSFTSNLFFRLYLHLQRAPLPIYFSIYLSISSTLYLSIYLFIYLSINLSICRYACLTIHLCIYLSTW